jgi:hypothetical protein
MRQMAMEVVLPEGGEVRPIPLNGTVRLQIRYEQEQQLLYALGQSVQPTSHFLPDSYLVCHTVII